MPFHTLGPRRRCRPEEVKGISTANTRPVRALLRTKGFHGWRVKGRPGVGKPWLSSPLTARRTTHNWKFLPQEFMAFAFGPRGEEMTV